MNDYVTRKSELYMRAAQSLSRVKPHYETQSRSGNNRTWWSDEVPRSRRNSWTSEPSTADGPENEGDGDSGAAETRDTAQTSQWSSGTGWSSWQARPTETTWNWN